MSSQYAASFINGNEEFKFMNSSFLLSVSTAIFFVTKICRHDYEALFLIWL